MIQLMCKKRFRFKNPNRDMIKRETVGTGKDVKTIQVESGAKFEEVYVEVTPGELCAVPDWVRADPMFDWGVKEGSILEVETKSQTQAEAKQQQADNTRASDDAKKAEEAAAAREKLSSMTKLELQQYASENHELELSNSMTKDAMLKAIDDAAKDAAEANEAEKG